MKLAFGLLSVTLCLYAVTAGVAFSQHDWPHGAICAVAALTGSGFLWAAVRESRHAAA